MPTESLPSIDISELSCRTGCDCAPASSVSAAAILICNKPTLMDNAISIASSRLHYFFIFFICFFSFPFSYYRFQDSSEPIFSVQFFINHLALPRKLHIIDSISFFYFFIFWLRTTLLHFPWSFLDFPFSFIFL